MRSALLMRSTLHPGVGPYPVHLGVGQYPVHLGVGGREGAGRCPPVLAQYALQSHGNNREKERAPVVDADKYGTWPYRHQDAHPSAPSPVVAQPTPSGAGELPPPDPPVGDESCRAAHGMAERVQTWHRRACAASHLGEGHWTRAERSERVWAGVHCGSGGAVVAPVCPSPPSPMAH